MNLLVYIMYTRYLRQILKKKALKVEEDLLLCNGKPSDDDNNLSQEHIDVDLFYGNKSMTTKPN